MQFYVVTCQPSFRKHWHYDGNENQAKQDGGGCTQQIAARSVFVTKMPPVASNINWKRHWLRALPPCYGMNFENSSHTRPSLASLTSRE
jgi:hypothetical protein